MNGLGDIVALLKLYTLTALNLAGEDTVLVMFVHSEKQVGLLNGVHSSCSTVGKH